jgi:hypothetical protein
VLEVVAGAVGLWGLGLLLTGLTLGLVRTPVLPGSVAQVFPGILIFGGGSTALLGLGLWATARARTLLVRLRPNLGPPDDPAESGVDSRGESG